MCVDVASIAPQARVLSLLRLFVPLSAGGVVVTWDVAVSAELAVATVCNDML